MSKTGIGGNGAARLRCWVVTIERSSGETSHSFPARVNHVTRRWAGMPRFISTWE